jgi:hypothetical protein
VATAAHSLKSVFETWKNDDLSFGEKLTSSFMGLSMTIPMLISGMSSLTTAYGATIGAASAFKKVLASESA